MRSAGNGSLPTNVDCPRSRSQRALTCPFCGQAAAREVLNLLRQLNRSTFDVIDQPVIIGDSASPGRSSPLPNAPRLEPRFNHRPSRNAHCDSSKTSPNLTIVHSSHRRTSASFTRMLGRQLVGFRKLLFQLRLQRRKPLWRTARRHPRHPPRRHTAPASARGCAL